MEPYYNHELRFPEIPVLEKSISDNIEMFELPVFKKHNSENFPLVKYIRELNKEIFNEAYELPFPDYDDIINEFANNEPKVPRQLPDRVLLRELAFFNGPEEVLGNHDDVQPAILPVIQVEPPNGEIRAVVEQAAKKEDENDENELLGLYNLMDELAPTLQKTVSELCRDHLKDSPFHHVDVLDPYSVKCPICITKQLDYHHLGCQDNFCITCIALLLKNYIDTSYVFPDEILCPMCSNTISDDIVKKFTDQETFKKMLDLRENLRVQRLVSQNKAIYCVVPGCEGFGHIIPDEKITACTKCRCSICTACKCAVHPGISCEEAVLLNPDTALDELLMSQN